MSDVGARPVILGIGNVLNRDEGLGVHALAQIERRLSEAGLEDVELVDGGVLGLSLLPLVERTERLLVVDAVDAGAPPGTVVELDRDRIRLFTGVKLSEHQVTFQEVLGLAAFRGALPGFLHLVGVQPADTSIGLGMSEPVAAVIPGVVERCLGVLARWRTLPAPAEAGRA